MCARGVSCSIVVFVVLRSCAAQVRTKGGSCVPGVRLRGMVACLHDGLNLNRSHVFLPISAFANLSEENRATKLATPARTKQLVRMPAGAGRGGVSPGHIGDWWEDGERHGCALRVGGKHILCDSGDRVVTAGVCSCLSSCAFGAQVPKSIRGHMPPSSVGAVHTSRSPPRAQEKTMHMFCSYDSQVIRCHHAPPGQPRGAGAWAVTRTNREARQRRQPGPHRAGGVARGRI